LTLARKIDALLKRSVVASVFLASFPAGYYYLVHLPRQDAQLESERVLERLRTAAQKRAEQELFLFEQQVSEQRAAEQKAAEEQQVLEKASRYQACLSRTTDSYNASRLAACNRPRDKIIKDQDDCVKLGFSRNVCAMAHVVPEISPNCTLPRAVRLALDADVEKARDRCLEENKDGFEVTSSLSSTQIRTSGLGSAIAEPVEPASSAPSLKARAPEPIPAASPAVPPNEGAGLTEPIPVPARVSKPAASGSKSAATPSAAAMLVVPRPPEAGAQYTERLPQTAPTHGGWIIQVGAFDIEREAQRQLSSAHAKAGQVLDNADPFTEVVMKGDKTLYRARFAGFQQKDEAEAACKLLKSHNIDCITVKN
jgi:hypothetical protein